MYRVMVFLGVIAVILRFVPYVLLMRVFPTIALRSAPAQMETHVFAALTSWARWRLSTSRTAPPSSV